MTDENVSKVQFTLYINTVSINPNLLKYYL